MSGKEQSSQQIDGAARTHYWLISGACGNAIDDSLVMGVADPWHRRHSSKEHRNICQATQDYDRCVLGRSRIPGMDDFQQKPGNTRRGATRMDTTQVLKRVESVHCSLEGDVPDIPVKRRYTPT